MSAPGTWTRSEFVHVLRREYRLGRYEIILLLGLFVYAAILGHLVLDLIVGLLVYSLAVMGILPYALWKFQPAFAEPRTVTVRDEGVTFSAASFAITMDWSVFSGSKERNEYFALQRKNRERSAIILKRFLNEPTDEDQLRILLRVHAKLSP